MTVAEYLERWLTEHAEANLAPKTYLRHRGLLRTHVIPRIGDIRLEKLRPDDVVRLVAALRDAPRGRKSTYSRRPHRPAGWLLDRSMRV